MVMVRRLSVEVTTGQNFSLHTGDPSGLGSLFTEEFFFSRWVFLNGRKCPCMWTWHCNNTADVTTLPLARSFFFVERSSVVHVRLLPCTWWHVVYLHCSATRLDMRASEQWRVLCHTEKSIFGLYEWVSLPQMCEEMQHFSVGYWVVPHVVNSV